MKSIEAGEATAPSKQLEEEYQSIRGLTKQREGMKSNPSYAIQRNSKSCLPSIGGAKGSERGSGPLASAERRLNMSTEQAFGGSLVNKTTVLDQTNASNDLELFRNASKTKAVGLIHKGDFSLDQTNGGGSEFAVDKLGEADFSVTLQQPADRQAALNLPTIAKNATAERLHELTGG